MTTGLLHTRCDPYGAESRIKLMGGMYPESYNGPQHWFCRNPATHRVVMECPRGHRGEIMPLCDDHHGEIQHRQAGICLTCAFPPEARACHDDVERAMATIAEMIYVDRLDPLDPHVMEQQREIERCRVRMNELAASGRTPRIPLRLIEVS